MPRLIDIKLKSCILAFFGSVILAFGLFNIHSVSDITEGGILGLTLLLERWIGISPAVSGLILDAACYIWAWRTLGGEFAVYSLISCVGFSVSYAFFEKVGHIWPSIGCYPFAAAICGALFVGVGVGLAVYAGAAPGGDDALAMCLTRITRVPIQWIYLLGDVTVLSLSLSYIPIKRIFYSLITVTLSGQIVGFIGKDRENDCLPEG